MKNRKRTLTTPSPTIAQLSMANSAHHFLHSMPETHNTHNGNGHFTNDSYQTTQTRRHAHNTVPFRMKNTSHEQKNFYHGGSPRSNSSLYSTFPPKYHIHA